MKTQKIVFYVLKWIALVVIAILYTAEVHSGSKRIIMFLLIGFIFFTLIREGIRDFKTRNN
jgi:hypothetical protein